MKKLQVIALASVLSLGAGTVFATTAAPDIDKISKNISVYDPELAKAIESGEVKVYLEGYEEEPLKIDKVNVVDMPEEAAADNDMELEITDNEVMQALQKGELEVFIDEEAKADLNKSGF